MPSNTEQKKVDEPSPAIKVLELLDGMDQLESKHVPDGAYKNMWDELYGLLVNVLDKSEAQEVMEEESESEQVVTRREVREPQRVKEAVRQVKRPVQSEYGDDDDLLE